MSATPKCASSSLYQVNHRFPVLRRRGGCLDSSVVTAGSKLSGPEPALATEMAALPWPKAQWAWNDRKKPSLWFSLLFQSPMRLPEVDTPAAFDVEPLCGVSRREVRLCRSDRTDRRDLAKPLRGHVLLALRQQVSVRFSAQRSQRIQLLVVQLRPPAHSGSLIFPSHSA
jgi:hypothetical protein